VVLAEPEWLHIKGIDDPVSARRLLSISPGDGLVGRAEASLVGRRWELPALDAIVDRAISHRGGVVNAVGAPGTGKPSRRSRGAGSRSRARSRFRPAAVRPCRPQRSV
jgi:hypothetical protein